MSSHRDTKMVDVPSARESPNRDTARVRVVVALELRLEREIIRTAMAIMRPNWIVSDIPPARLIKLVENETPDVIVCNTHHINGVDKPRVLIQLHPFGDNRCTVTLDDQSTETVRPTFKYVLETIDREYG